MALLSRLRHPLISRCAPSLFKARFLSSSRSFALSCSNLDANGSFSRLEAPIIRNAYQKSIYAISLEGKVMPSGGALQRFVSCKLR